jgi:hypothetical protein
MIAMSGTNSVLSGNNTTGRNLEAIRIKTNSLADNKVDVYALPLQVFRA